MERDPYRISMVKDELNHKYAKYIRTAKGNLYVRAGESQEGDIMYVISDRSSSPIKYSEVSLEGIVARGNDIEEEGILCDTRAH